MKGWLALVARALELSMDEAARLTVAEAGRLLKAKAGAGPQRPKAPPGAQRVSMEEMAKLLGGGNG